MSSTGEVMGVDADPGRALPKALIASGSALPRRGAVFVSVANRDNRAIVFPAKRLPQMDFDILATQGTAGVLERAGVPVERVAKLSEGSRSIVDLIRDGRASMVVNTPFGRAPRTDGYQIRTAAAMGVPTAQPPAERCPRPTPATTGVVQR